MQRHKVTGTCVHKIHIL